MAKSAWREQQYTQRKRIYKSSTTLYISIPKETTDADGPPNRLGTQSQNALPSRSESERPEHLDGAPRRLDVASVVDLQPALARIDHRHLRRVRVALLEAERALPAEPDGRELADV